MGTKELKIQAPKGFEIDEENSTLECIKFKPINENITYEDICEKIFKEKVFFTEWDGNIAYNFNFCQGDEKFNANNSTNKRHLKKLLALNQLLNIAEYYNKNTPKLDVRYRIYYDKSIYCYKTAHYTYYSNKFSVEALFNREEDAQAVIDNPNFREILNTIYENTKASTCA